jgi:hypothetical protein
MKLMSRYVFLLDSSPITWGSRKQPCITLSSIEAKYVAMTNATKEAIWLRELLGDNQIVINPKPISLMVDNQSAIKLSNTSSLV